MSDRSALIDEIRARVAQMPRISRMLEHVLEQFEGTDMSKSEREDALRWLHYAVKYPQLAQLIYSMAQLVQSTSIPVEYEAMRTPPSMTS